MVIIILIHLFWQRKAQAVS